MPRPPRPPAKVTRRYCALYARVSRDEGELENQLTQLRAYALARDWTITDEFTDTESGGKGTDHRPGLRALLEEAERLDFDTVLVWSLDRLSRTHLFTTCQIIAQLRENKVHLVSLQEPWFETAGPAGDILIAFAAWIAEQDLKRMSERVKAGMSRAAAQGRKPGRPRKQIDADTRSAVEAALKADQPMSTVEAPLSRATLYRLRQSLTGSGGRHTYRANFTGPQGTLNPMGLRINDLFCIELFSYRARWNARIIPPSTAAPSKLPLPSYATLADAQAGVCTLFTQQVDNWTPYRESTPIATKPQETTPNEQPADRTNQQPDEDSSPAA